MKILNVNRLASGRFSVAMLVLAAATVVVSSRGEAMRHLRLVRSFPAADTVLVRSPDAVRLWWSEPPELPFTKIELKNARGVALRLRPATRSATKDASVVASIVAPLPPGGYNVSWRTMSKDGHVMKGTFAFRVGTPSSRN